jgi:DNA-binding response OmpR family regulator
MGFTLDTSTIRELAATIAAEVIQAMRAARISTVVIDELEVVHVGPLTVDLGRREASLHGRALSLKPRELSLLAALACWKRRRRSEPQAAPEI